MRMRTRMVKPEFFKDEELVDAEVETGLPLRLAYEGLWCASDREGRFEWRPRALKVEIFPYENHDFSRVLDALWTGGWLVKYVSSTGKTYGWMPTFLRHQSPNNREHASDLPSPDDCRVTVPPARTSMRAPHVRHASGTRHDLDEADSSCSSSRTVSVAVDEATHEPRVLDASPSAAPSKLTEQGKAAYATLTAHHRNPMVVAAELRAIVDGMRAMHPEPTWEGVSQALVDMVTNEVESPTANALRGFVRNAMRQLTREDLPRRLDALADEIGASA